MLTFLRRRLFDMRGVQFCETCSEVSTVEHRSQTRLDHAHTHINQQQYLVIR